MRAPRTVLPLVLAAAALLAPAAPAAAQEPTTLVVIDSASVRATPDAAVITAEVGRTAPTRARARRATERRLRTVLGALEGIGIPAADLRTEFFQTYSMRRRGKRVWIATRALRVRVADITKLEAVLDALSDAVSGGGPEYIVSDPTEERQEATRIALQRARARADAAAAALGMRVTATVRVDLNPEFGYLAGAGSGEQLVAFTGSGDEASGGGGAVVVEEGQNEIVVAVAVVYEIGP